MAKRCLIVSYYFPPTGGSGVQRITKLIKYLSLLNWRFSVITADEQSNIQPRDPTLLKELPANLSVIKVSSELPVRRIGFLKKLSFFDKATYWKRWLGAWLYLPDIRKGWNVPAKKAIIKELQKNKYDCLLFTIPPYSLSLLAVELQKEIDIPVIVDLRDPWSMHPYKIHPTGWHKKRDQQIEFKTIADVRFGVSAYKELLVFYRQHIPGFKTDNWQFIPNGFDEADFLELQPQELEPGFFHIGFSGTIHSHINNPNLLFRAIAELKRKESGAAKKILFHHVGKSILDVRKIAKKYNLEDQIRLWGYLPHRKSLEILNAMDVFALIHDDRHEASTFIVGGKVYEYLRLKKPIMALVPEEGEAAQLIRYTDSGKVISPSKSGLIEKTLRDWQENTPGYGFKNIEEFSRERQAEQLGRFLEKVIQTK